MSTSARPNAGSGASGGIKAIAAAVVAFGLAFVGLKTLDKLGYLDTSPKPIPFDTALGQTTAIAFYVSDDKTHRFATADTQGNPSIIHLIRLASKNPASEPKGFSDCMLSIAPAPTVPVTYTYYSDSGIFASSDQHEYYQAPKSLRAWILSRKESFVKARKAGKHSSAS